MKIDAVIVGAGFAGLYMLHRLRSEGFTATIIEAAPDVGGTWYWNRYPGARCDVQSMLYSYSFSEELQQEWEWTERYASQPEILRYINHVADRFDLRRDVQFDTRVTRAVFDETESAWNVTTNQGDEISARFCVMATGCLSTPRRPDFEGLDSFAGLWYHTGYWPHEDVDFSGQRVGMIGTGSSSIQSIPIIAEQAAHLTVFQRTANFSVPAWNHPLDPGEVTDWKARYAEIRHGMRTGEVGVLGEVNLWAAADITAEQQQKELERRWQQGGLVMWGPFTDVLLNKSSNTIAGNFVRDKIRETVEDPATAELLCPTGYPYGGKRICVDTDYYKTFNRDNISLKDISTTPIDAITPAGLTIAGQEYQFDSLIFATGFDAMTGTLLRMDIHGRDGLSLKEKWAAGPRTYLGMMTAGFPNLFTITGPGSPSVLSNMIVSIEQHVDWMADAMIHLRDNGLDSIEPAAAAEDGWVNHVNELANATLLPEADSWYMGANIPGKPRVFMPYLAGVGPYREICDSVTADGYRGFELRA
ncbi:MAG: NAD(P)/FAD-dependent oxidoreductase [Gammaproteobacteria bacterium]|nr:NAD(P)/FAD-dependent oxidoreductase [Gammaproteobacteria bacterium]